MCDYSLELVASRPARVGDKLVSTDFACTYTRGFASVEAKEIAVCLLPGTELVFEENVAVEGRFPFRPRRRIEYRVARFREINQDRAYAHHDAIEFPDGELVLLTQVSPGQRATVLQLPQTARDSERVQSARANASVA